MTKRPDRAPAVDFEVDGQILRQSMLRQLPKRLFGSSELRLPAVPALLEHYVETLAKLFALHGRPYSESELEQLRGLLASQLERGFAAGRNSLVVVKYQTDEPPKKTLSYTFALEVLSAEQEHAISLRMQAPPLARRYPDCKVLELARSLGAPADVCVLDLAAGVGRNALPLARAGFACDAVEWRPELAAQLRVAVAKEAPSTRLFEFELLGAEEVESLAPPAAHYQLAFLCDLSADFRDTAALERVFERAAKFVRPGGSFLFNAFVPIGGYQPDRLARELAFVFWSSLFLREELKAVAGAHGFALLAEEGMADYERARLPAGAWPPSEWFEEWARGVDTFDLSGSRAPVELRWLTYKKQA